MWLMWLKRDCVFSGFGDSVRNASGAPKSPETEGVLTARLADAWASTSEEVRRDDGERPLSKGLRSRLLIPDKHFPAPEKMLLMLVAADSTVVGEPKSWLSKSKDK